MGDPKVNGAELAAKYGLEPITGAEAAKKYGLESADGPSIPTQPKTGKAEAFFRGAGDIAGMSLGDELAGVGSKLAGLLSDDDGDIPRAAGRGIDAPVSDRTDYDVSRDAERAANAQALRDRPGYYRGGQVAGGVLTSALPIAKAAPAATWGARALQAAKVGAPLGAITGWGASEDPTDVGQAFDALQGGMAGAVFAPVAGEVVHQAALKGQPILAAAKRYLGDKAEKFLQQQGMQAEISHGPELAGKGKLYADPSSPEGAKLRQLARAGTDEDAIGQHAKDLSDKVSELWHNADVVKWHEDIASKRPLIKKMMASESVDPKAAIEGSDHLIKNTLQGLHEITSYVEPGTPDRTLINKVEKEIKEYSLRPMQGDDVDVAADRYMRVDQVKREIQGILDGIKDRHRRDPTFFGLNSLETNLREYLENAGVWGEGSSGLQKIRNRSWREAMLLNNKDANPRRTFLTDASGETAMDPYRAKLIADPGSVTGIVKNAHTFEGAPEVRLMKEWANREADLLEALTTHVDADPDLLARAARARELAKEINEGLDQRISEGKAADELQRLTQGADTDIYGGKISKLMHKVPGYGIVSEAKSLPGVADRAKALASLENALSVNPNNTLAQKQLERIKTLSTVPDRVRQWSGTPTQNVRQFKGGLAENVVRTAAGSSSGRYVANSLTDRVRDVAASNPDALGRYGRVLAQSKSPDDFAVKHATLMSTDQDYRQRVRKLAEQHDDEQDAAANE